jgi:hypothetical protein
MQYRQRNRTGGVGTIVGAGLWVATVFMVMATMLGIALVT